MKNNKTYSDTKPSEEQYKKAKDILKDMVIGEKLYGDELIEVLAYFIKYLVIKVKDKDDWLGEASKCLATAPWMAHRDNDFYKDYIQFLIDNDIISYDGEYRVFYNDAEKEYEAVELNEIEDSFEKIYKYITEMTEKKQQMTLKMSVFHARTFLNFLEKKGQPMVELLEKHPNLRIKILCVGKYSGEVAREGADDEHLENAIVDGMMNLYNIAEDNKKQFQIKMIKDNIVDASLRVCILMEKDRIELCHFLDWRVGKERGIHGKTYETAFDSSLAIQLNQLFEEAFLRAIPLRKDYVWLIYQLTKVQKIVRTVLILFAINVILFVIPKLYSGSVDAIDVIESIVNVVGAIILERIMEGIKRKTKKEW